MRTELPQNWCIELNKINKTPQNYFDKQSNNTCYTIYYNNGYLHSKNLMEQDITLESSKEKVASFHNSSKRPGFVVISIEEFEKFVLNKTIEINYEIY